MAKFDYICASTRMGSIVGNPVRYEGATRSAYCHWSLIIELKI